MPLSGSERVTLEMMPQHKEWCGQRGQDEGVSMSQYIRDLIEDDMANGTSSNSHLNMRVAEFRDRRDFRGRRRDA